MTAKKVSQSWIVALVLLILTPFYLYTQTHVHRKKPCDIIILTSSQPEQQNFASAFIRELLIPDWSIPGDRYHVVNLSGKPAVTGTVLFGEKNFTSTINSFIQNIPSGQPPSDTHQTLRFLSEIIPKDTSYGGKLIFYFYPSFQKPVANDTNTISSLGLGREAEELAEKIKNWGGRFVLIGEKGDGTSRHVSDFLSAEMIETEWSGNPSGVKTRWKEISGYWEWSMKRRLGYLNRRRKIKIKLHSVYSSPMNGTIQGAYLHDVSRREKLGSVQTDNLLIYSVPVRLKPGQSTNVVLVLAPLKDIQWGKYQAFLKLNIDGGIQCFPDSIPVRLRAGAIIWLWALGILGFIFVFKRYPLAWAESWIEHRKHRLLSDPNSFTGKILSRIAEWSATDSISWRILSGIWYGVDKVAEAIVKGIVVGVKGLITGLWYVLVGILKGIGYGIFLPIGFVFRIIGDGFLKIKEYIDKLRFKR